MLENIPGNFKSCVKFNETGLNYFSCQVDMSQDHCALCPERAELPAGLKMNNIDNVVIYFQQYQTHENIVNLFIYIAKYATTNKINVRHSQDCG